LKVLQWSRWNRKSVGS